MNNKNTRTVWIARGFIGLVTLSNLVAALPFILNAERYAPGFELSGVPGAAMIRGVGLLFLMWNVPYVVALIHPNRYFISLVEAVIMQAIGVIGETLILICLPEGHLTLRTSATRFIYFDASGLVVLLAALGLMIQLRKKT